MMNQEARLRAEQPVVTTDNTRVPLALALLALVTRGRGALRSPLQYGCSRADGYRERT
jgi:hypothetical protein